MLGAILLWCPRLHAAGRVAVGWVGALERIFQLVREVGVAKVERVTVLVIVERVVMVVKEVVGVLRMVKVVRMSIAVPVVRETRIDQRLVFFS
jgi:hypothetical protein